MRFPAPPRARSHSSAPAFDPAMRMNCHGVRHAVTISPAGRPESMSPIRRSDSAISSKRTVTQSRHVAVAMRRHANVERVVGAGGIERASPTRLRSRGPQSTSIPSFAARVSLAAAMKRSCSPRARRRCAWVQRNGLPASSISARIRAMPAASMSRATPPGMTVSSVAVADSACSRAANPPAPRKLCAPECEPASLPRKHSPTMLAHALALEQAARAAIANVAAARRTVAHSHRHAYARRRPPSNRRKCSSEFCALGERLDSKRFSTPLVCSRGALPASIRFAHDRKTKMPRLDRASVHRSHRNLVNSLAADLHERIRVPRRGKGLPAVERFAQWKHAVGQAGDATIFGCRLRFPRSRDEIVRLRAASGSPPGTDRKSGNRSPASGSVSPAARIAPSMRRVLRSLRRDRSHPRPTMRPAGRLSRAPAGRLRAIARNPRGRATPAWRSEGSLNSSWKSSSFIGRRIHELSITR